MAMTIYTDETARVRTETIELNVEELEEVIAPGRRMNHNETLVRDEIELSVEELEEVIAPIVRGRVDQPDPPNRPQRGAWNKRRLALAQFSLNEHGEATITRS